MYEISVRMHFDAAHYLRGYHGKCENLHGHRYEVIVTVRAEETNEIGIACDFTELKYHLGEVLHQFDHRCLNDVTPFDKINPSAENIAHTIYNKLKPRLDKTPASICRVEVWESPDSRVAYTPKIS